MTAQSTPTGEPTPSYHRSDPLDIPLIDDHILTRLLLPRIVSAVKLAFPRLHLDWTTDAHASTSGGQDNNALAWKRVLVACMRSCLLLGSCHRIFLGDKQGGIRIATPAMQSLGMFIQPAPSTWRDDARNHRSQQQNSETNTSFFQSLQARMKVKVYAKILALVLSTIIFPALYSELKYRRTRELEDRERLRRLEEIRREVMIGANQQGEHQNRRNQEGQHQDAANILQQRSQQRKSKIQSLLTDTILGMGDVLLPPLRLASYLSYLWGTRLLNVCTNTPNLGMLLAGWEYVPTASNANVQHQHQGYQRHANFQYGNRRLLVEEALRTASMVLPPRRSVDNIADAGVASNAITIRHDNAINITASQDDNSTSERGRGITRGRGVLKRYLSFMGVAAESDDAALASYNVRGGERPQLPCSMCRTEKPTVPYMASPCGHCYCYLCLRTAVTDDLQFRCVDCGKRVVSSYRRG